MHDRHTAVPHTATDNAADPGRTYARHGWSGTLHAFVESAPSPVLAALQRFVPDAEPAQVAAWRDSLRLLRVYVQALLAADPATAAWSLVLEYEVPMEARRADTKSHGFQLT